MREKAEDSYRLNASELFGARKARCRCGDREDLCGEDDEAHDLFGEAGECAGDAHGDSLQSTAGSSGGNAPASTSISISSFECAPSFRSWHRVCSSDSQSKEM